MGKRRIQLRNRGFRSQEPCWCGAPTCYEECHKSIEQVRFQQANEADWSGNILENYPKCGFPSVEFSCTKNPIDAHTIQKQGPLQRIKTSTNRVWSMKGGFPDTKMLPIPNLRTIRKASTFPGLCHEHDKIFTPLEEKPHNLSKRNLFLMCFRTLLFELHQKRAWLELVRKGIVGDDPRIILSMDDLLYNLEIYLEIYQSNYLDDFEIHLVEACGNTEVVSSGFCFAYATLSGFHLYEPAAEGSGLPGYAFATHTAEDKTYYIFGVYKKHRYVSTFLETKFKSIKENEMGEIWGIFFLKCENTFFSEDWWFSLDIQNRTRVRVECSKTHAEQAYSATKGFPSNMKFTKYQII